MSTLRNPESHAQEAVRDFMERPYHILGGKAKTIFNDEFKDDLASLRAPAETDMLSRILRRNWPGKVSF